MKRKSILSTMGRLTLGVALGAAMTAGTTIGALAESTPTGGVQHIIDCFHLLLTDSAAHARECSPSTVPAWDPLVPTSGGGPNCTPVAESGVLAVPPRAVNVASLGAGSEFLPRIQAGGFLLTSEINPCCQQSMLTAPVAVDGVLVASLEDFAPTFRPANNARTLAYLCPE